MTNNVSHMTSSDPGHLPPALLFPTVEGTRSLDINHHCASSQRHQTTHCPARTGRTPGDMYVGRHRTGGRQALIPNLQSSDKCHTCHQHGSHRATTQHGCMLLAARNLNVVPVTGSSVSYSALQQHQRVQQLGTGQCSSATNYIQGPPD